MHVHVRARRSLRRGLFCVHTLLSLPKIAFALESLMLSAGVPKLLDFHAQPKLLS
jgi:hypothetical protein